MKIYYLLILILSYFFTPVNNNNKNGIESEVTLKAIYRGYYNFPRENAFNESDSSYYFLIEVYLGNNTNDEIEFLTHSCLPIDNIVLKSNDFKVCPNNCAKNMSFPVILDPEQEFSMIVILQANKNKIDSRIEIGWAFLTMEITKSYDNYFDFLSRSKSTYENVIWSNEIYLDSWSGQPVVIK